MRDNSTADNPLEEAKLSGELDRFLKDYFVINIRSGEKIIGLVRDEEVERLKSGDPTLVVNARGIFSMNVPIPGRGVMRKTMIGTLDLALGPVKEITVLPASWYRVTDQDTRTKLVIHQELQEADQRDTMQRAADAGIALAQTAPRTEVSDRQPFSGLDR